MELTPEELRVLACLIEKSYTTPDQYPLSSNALTAACNQKTSRDPVVDYSSQLVDQTLLLLRDGGWVRSVRGVGNRAFKHKHVLHEKLGLTPAQEAIFAVLALRGPQSAGELRTRTERYAVVGNDGPMAEVEDIERSLMQLRDRQPSLARNVGRAAGQSQDRWIQLICVDSAEAEPSGTLIDQAPSRPNDLGDEPTSPDPSSPLPLRPEASGSESNESVLELRQRVDELEHRLARLEAELGIED